MADIGTVLTGAGTLLGAAFSAFFARRAANSTRKVQTSIEGPDDEPGLRDMVKASRAEELSHYKDLHGDLVHVTDRLENVETMVVKGHEVRLRKLEDSTVQADLINTTLRAIDGRVASLAEDTARNGLNLHIVANVAQATLLTREEARLKFISVQESNKQKGETKMAKEKDEPKHGKDPVKPPVKRPDPPASAEDDPPPETPPDQ